MTVIERRLYQFYRQRFSIHQLLSPKDFVDAVYEAWQKKPTNLPKRHGANPHQQPYVSDGSSSDLPRYR